MGLNGIVFYEPTELVIRARAGTPIAEIEAALAEQDQMLAFEPMDHRLLFGTSGDPTIGGLTATNSSGPRRINAGAARDALLGANFVNGRGEVIKTGGRVMKNVTGLDLGKVLCGSYGTLGFLTEVAFKVLPKPAYAATLAIEGLSDSSAIETLAKALGSPFESTGAAHLPEGIGGNLPQTLVRLEGHRESVEYRLEAVAQRLRGDGNASVLDSESSAQIWIAIRDAAFFAPPDESYVWRISTVPSAAAAIVNEVAKSIVGARWLYDWGGGLIWLSVPPSDGANATEIRATLDEHGGHATLIRAPEVIRRTVPPFQPPSGPKAMLAERLKESFDPKGVFGLGRMYGDL